MAELAPKGTYVKLIMHIWYDRRNDNIHLTAGPDPDLPPGGIHMTAKKGTQSDRNFRTLLESFGVPASREAAVAAAQLIATNDSQAIAMTIDKLGPRLPGNPMLQTFNSLVARGWIAYPQKRREGEGYNHEYVRLVRGPATVWLEGHKLGVGAGGKAIMEIAASLPGAESTSGGRAAVYFHFERCGVDQIVTNAEDLYAKAVEGEASEDNA